MDANQIEKANRAAEDFWNFGYDNHGLNDDEAFEDFDKLDSNIVRKIFLAGWNECLKSFAAEPSPSESNKPKFTYQDFQEGLRMCIDDGSISAGKWANDLTTNMAREIVGDFRERVSAKPKNNIEELIKSVHVDKSNFIHIAETGNINGTLLSELKRILNCVRSS